jgi:hypothetical protein
MPTGILGATTLEPGNSKIFISVMTGDDHVKAVFVHEYVHWLQVRAGWYAPSVLGKADLCALFGAELEAYAIGDKYVQDHNLSPILPKDKPHPIVIYARNCAEAHK